MKPSDFQKTVQCRFESCLKKVVRSVVKDYYKELNRRKNKEISFSELPDVLVDKMAVWDDYETAIEKLLAFYDPYISKCCLRSLYDEYGNVYIVVDMELKGRIREALIKMILGFDIEDMDLEPEE